MTKITATMKVRSVWISDVHLGFRGCQADTLLHFLHSVETEYLFLVGDIVDFWSIKKNPYWPQAHTNVIRSILGKAKHGTKVIFIPGNHDEAIRECTGHIFGNIEIHQDYVHTTMDGRKLLVMHGDEFDLIVKNSRLVANLGSAAYDTLLRINHYINGLRKFLGFTYWSLAAYLKLKVKNAVSYISSFEHALAHLAKDRKVDGVVCGHIHHAEIREIESVLYCNDGDWVESCSTLLEHPDGKLELVFWAEKFEQYQKQQALSTGKESTSTPKKTEPTTNKAA